MALVLAHGTPPPTVEEVDLLEQSTRKKKRTAAEANEPSGKDPSASHESPMSYRDSLLGGRKESIPTDWMEEEEAYDTESDDEGDPVQDGGYPRLRLSRATKQRIRSRWMNAAYGKIVGKSASYHDLHTRLKFLWKDVDFELLLIGKGWFVVRFVSRAIRCKILSGGPYFYRDHYIHLERWRPDFDVESATIDTTMAWMRFPSIALEYFDESAVLETAKMFGRPIKVDSTTAAISRGRFARVCVELDLSKPLVSRFWVRHKLHHVVYEGLPLICYVCGRVGHKDVHCPHVIRVPENTQREEGPELGENTQREGDAMADAASPPKDASQETPYGEWMQVQRRRRKGSNKSRASRANIGVDSQNQGLINKRNIHAAGDSSEARNAGSDPKTHARMAVNEGLNPKDVAVAAPTDSSAVANSGKQVNAGSTVSNATVSQKQIDDVAGPTCDVSGGDSMALVCVSPNMQVGPRGSLDTSFLDLNQPSQGEIVTNPVFSFGSGKSSSNVSDYPLPIPKRTTSHRKVASGKDKGFSVSHDRRSSTRPSIQ